MISYVTLFYVCAQVVRRKKRSLLTKYVFPLLEGVGHAVGVVTFIFSLCLYGFGLVMMMDLAVYSREIFLLSYTANWVLTNFVYYVAWDFFIYFNPFVCCVPSQAANTEHQPVTLTLEQQRRRRRRRSGGLRSVMSSFIDVVRQCLLWVGVAQWQVERLRARDKLRKALSPNDSLAKRLKRVLSKPKLSVEVKKLQ